MTPPTQNRLLNICAHFAVYIALHGKRGSVDLDGDSILATRETRDHGTEVMRVEITDTPTAAVVCTPVSGEPFHDVQRMETGLPGMLAVMTITDFLDGIDPDWGPGA